jgi:hypothetical protein
MNLMANMKTASMALATGLTLLTACGGGGMGDVVADINGTGFTAKGQITAFGSVVVNGVRYNTDNAQFTVDDAPGSQADLFVGQQVVVKGSNNGDGTGVADRVIFDADLEGPVSAIDRPNNAFTVLGQTVIVAGDTVFERTSFATLAIDDTVEVSATLDANGALRALSVEAKPVSSSEFEVEGVVSNLNTGMQTFTINGLTVDFSAAVFDPSNLQLANGQLVEAEGSASGNTLTASRVELEDDFEAEDGDEGELEGFIQSVDSGTQFTVANVTVVHGSSTRFENGTAADLVPNAEVEVEGTVDANSVLQASQIEFESEDEQELAIRIEAPVQGTDTQNRTVTVLGITIATDNQTQFKDERDDVRPFSIDQLVVGDYVELRAFFSGQILIAGRIERDSSTPRVRLQSLLDSTDMAANQIVIEGVTVDTSSADFRDANDNVISATQFYATAQPGDLVRARGSFDGQSITADEVSFESADEQDEDDDENDDGEDEDDDG